MPRRGEGGLVWDEATLRDYLHNPKAKVKGTKMVFVGLKDDSEITNLIAYLKQFSQWTGADVTRAIRDRVHSAAFAVVIVRTICS